MKRSESKQGDPHAVEVAVELQVARKARLAALAGLSVLGVAAYGTASAQIVSPPPFPADITVFPMRDFLGIAGYLRRCRCAHSGASRQLGGRHRPRADTAESIPFSSKWAETSRSTIRAGSAGRT